MIEIINDWCVANDACYVLQFNPLGGFNIRVHDADHCTPHHYNEDLKVAFANARDNFLNLKQGKNNE